MKKFLFYIFSCIALVSCSSEQDGLKQEGYLHIASICIDSDCEILPLSRAVDNTLQVDIYQGTTKVRTIPAGDESLNGTISLPVGNNYKVRAHTAVETDAANNETGNPIYAGEQAFVINPDETTEIQGLVAKQINVGISLQYNNTFSDFTNFVCTIQSPTSNRTVSISGMEDKTIYYFNVPDVGQKLQYKVEAVNEDGEAVTTGFRAIEVEGGKNYVLTIDWE